MRLINCITYELEEFIGNNTPKYAILSHTWGHEEVLFSDLPLRQPSTTAKSGYQKIQFTCGQAIRDGLAYAWVDTCCIDKTSSAELSEAINSMFYWYSNSTNCYAFLEDVLADEFERDLPESRWFTRGWTLQELIAPTKVFFYDKSWMQFGDRHTLSQTIFDITRIDLAVLRYGLVNRRHGYMASDKAISLDTLCIARKMSWASSRITSRPEDVAYCLLGIFDINMPLLYGEGERAFVRLQEEIMKRSDSDDSILAWGLNSETILSSSQEIMPVLDGASGGVPLESQELLARSPKAFENCRDLTLSLSSDVSFSLTNTGINLQILTVYMEVPEGRSKHGHCLIGLLSCSPGVAMRSHVLGIILHPVRSDDEQQPIRTVYRGAALSLSDYKVSQTVFMSTRDAIRRTESNITIVRMNRQFGPFDESYVINNSKNFFEKLGWRLADVTGWSLVRYFNKPDHVPREPKDWDPTTMTYTRLAKESPLDMLSLEFSTQDGSSPSSYTLDINVESPNVRPEARSEAVFECKDGSYVQLTVNWIDEGTIHQWRVFSINIGIVDVF
ncbi:heterokaryon incompatibility protein-domain-containing protein [Alternaria rosae]|uniref:heterokaryon incompatibility protein-domain-containing protein n=1 Tax=Alternaria rosae TaxID=1187941 RepID=UPI001E8E0ED2|nr:heterokaryon incompatibility protein-domain-containing protein [Alternaria rosae]KAH6882029.1 heterokaryon incompatibility protein-domain-containing protein [Alternaria rosae]